MNKKITTNQIVMTGLFLALEIILQVIGNNVHFGPVSINLSLVAVVLAAVICGPLSGAILGFFNGLLVIFAPSTLAIFVPVNPIGTVFACFGKCTIAGIVAGLVNKLISKNNKTVGLTVSSILVPVINTGLFLVFALMFFQTWISANVGAEAAFKNVGEFLIVGVVGWNFLIELDVTCFLSVTAGLIILRSKK